MPRKSFLKAFENLAVLTAFQISKSEDLEYWALRNMSLLFCGSVTYPQLSEVLNGFSNFLSCLSGS